jgi:glutamate/aspartate transport system substrate-binding protein
MKLFILFLATVMSTAGMASAQAAGRLDKIKSTGVISIGYRDVFIPFSYLDDRQQPVGYGMDICLGIIDALKAKLNMPKLAIKKVSVTPATRIPLVANGTIDLACGSATNNAERQRQVSFAPTTFVTATRFLAPVSSKLKSLSDLKGKTVVATSGSSNMRWLVHANAEQKLNMKIVTAKENTDAFLAVASGRAHAFFSDDILLASLVATSHQPKHWMISDDAYTVEPYGIIEPKNDPEFKAVVDTAVKTMMQNGTMSKLYAKWFAQPIPPKNVNLNWPMTREVKKAIANPSDSPDPNKYK